jgi:hypothetical protein
MVDDFIRNEKLPLVSGSVETAESKWFGKDFLGNLLDTFTSVLIISVIIFLCIFAKVIGSQAYEKYFGRGGDI